MMDQNPSSNPLSLSLSISLRSLLPSQAPTAAMNVTLARDRFHARSYEREYINKSANCYLKTMICFWFYASSFHRTWCWEQGTLASLLASFPLSISSAWVAWNAKGLFPHLCWTLPGAAFLWFWTYVNIYIYICFNILTYMFFSMLALLVCLMPCFCSQKPKFEASPASWWWFQHC